MLSASLKREERIDAPAVARAAAALRGDAPQGAPDLFEGSHREQPPTLTEAVELQGDVVMSARGPDDLPPLTMSDGTPQDGDLARREPINARLAGLVRRQEPPRRRRKMVLASVTLVAVALAVLAYVADRRSSSAGFSESALRDVAALRSNASSGFARDPMPSDAASSPAPSTSALPESLPSPRLASPAPDGDGAEGNASHDSSASRDKAAERVPATAAAPERPGPAESAPAATPVPSCSAPAAALGLCEAERSSSKGRQ